MTLDTCQTQMSTGSLSVECAWHIVDDLYVEAIKPSETMGRIEVENELIFCLMGGFGVTYELGRSAASLICQLRPFSEEWGDEDLFNAISEALMKPQFDPVKADGTPRRYRFPFRKASAIVKARNWLHCNGPIHQRLLELESDRERREFLSECPGMGLKTASWLLRNLGMGAGLATVDVHVFRALAEAERIPNHLQMPRDYELVEEAFLEWCNEMQAPPAAFDLFLWHWQRGTLLNV